MHHVHSVFIFSRTDNGPYNANNITSREYTCRPSLATLFTPLEGTLYTVSKTELSLILALGYGKVGFSGEGRPREVLYAGGKSGTALWGLERAVNPADRAEENKLLSINLERCLRSVLP